MLFTDMDLCALALRCPAVESGSILTVTCTKPENGWPATFVVNVTATGGDADCSDSAEDTTDVTILTKPEVSLTGPTNEELCNESPSVTYEYTVSSGDAGVPLSITATPSDASVNCEAPEGTGTWQGPDRSSRHQQSWCHQQSTTFVYNDCI